MYSKFALLALGLYALPILGALRPDIKGAGVAELEPGQVVGPDTKTLQMPSAPGSPFEVEFFCPKNSGKQFALSKDKKFVGCCLPGQHLSGTAETEMHCCGENHELSGSPEVGSYECCHVTQEWDGKKCITPVPVCTNGKELVDGKCVCPAGTTEVSGKCEPLKCSSGIETGKCYTFTFENGLRFGYYSNGWYTASKEDKTHQFGKFKLCKTEDCPKGSPVNPGEGIRIKDIHGTANGGQNPNQWLDAKKNGDHISKTPNYDLAGVFTLTKWPCGKYCLGGLDAGIGPTCPSDLPAATFTTMDKQSCIPIELTEVPCDIHAVENNCIWDNGDQCCNKIDCSKDKA